MKIRIVSMLIATLSLGSISAHATTSYSGEAGQTDYTCGSWDIYDEDEELTSESQDFFDPDGPNSSPLGILILDSEDFNIIFEDIDIRDGFISEGSDLELVSRLRSIRRLVRQITRWAKKEFPYAKNRAKCLAEFTSRVLQCVANGGDVTLCMITNSGQNAPRSCFP